MVMAISASESIFDADLKMSLLFCGTSTFWDICMFWLPAT